MKSRFQILALSFLVLVPSACTSYVQTDVADLRPQDKVRLELEDEELAKLIAFADPATRSVNGRVVSSSIDSISVIVQTATAYTQVSIPNRSVVQAERGVADAKKNFIASALIVGAVAALAYAGFEGRQDNSTGDDTGIDESRVELFGFRIPFSLGFGR